MQKQQATPIFNPTAKSTPIQQNTGLYIPTLDGWRAIAILLVIGAHCAPMLINSGTKIGALLASVLSHAGFGVDVFFALSGFLICTLLLRERTIIGSISLRSFYIRRAFRILPPIIAYLIALLFLRLSNLLDMISLEELVAVLLFVRNYSEGSWYTAHFWSLAVEEHFYLVIPWILMIRSNRVLTSALIGFILACISIRAFEFSNPELIGSTLIQFRTENRIDALSWGALLALCLHSNRFTAWAKRNLKGWMISAVFLAVLVLLQLDSAGLRRTLVAATLPLLICYFVLNPKSYIGRILEWSPLRWIGKISYSLYIWQMLFLVPLDRPLTIFQDFPLAIFASVGCAICSFYFIEKPFIRIGHRLSAKISHPAIAQPI